MAAPAELDLVGNYAWTQGVEYDRQWAVTDGDDAAIDLSGTSTTASFVITSEDDDETELLALDQDDGLSLGGSDGIVTFDVSSATTAALTFCFAKYVFKVVVDGSTVALVSGRIQLVHT